MIRQPSLAKYHWAAQTAPRHERAWSAARRLGGGRRNLPRWPQTRQTRPPSEKVGRRGQRCCSPAPSKPGSWPSQLERWAAEVRGVARGAARTAAEACAARLAGAARDGVEILRVRLGRVRLAVIGDAKVKSLEQFIKSAIAPATEVTTDGHGGYLGLDQAGFTHARIIIARTGGKAHEYLPAVHLVFALLKRLMLGTYHGAPLGRPLPAYLDEFVFRFNRRAQSTAGRALRLIDRAVATLPITNRMIFGHA